MCFQNLQCKGKSTVGKQPFSPVGSILVTEVQLPGCHFALSNKEKKKPKALEGSKEESPVLPVMKITASWLRKKLRDGRLENQKEGGSRDLTSSGFGLCFYRIRPKKGGGVD